VIAISGSGDTNTLPNLSESYVAGLKAHGVAATFTLISDADHNSAFRSQTVIKAAIDLAKQR
jgi:hypothetical protein